MLALRTLATLVLLLAFALPAHAEPVTAGCTAAQTETPDGRTGHEAGCSAGSTSLALPEPETVFGAVDLTYGSLVSAGVCPPQGTCVDAGGAYLSSGNGTKKEYVGHVTLLR